MMSNCKNCPSSSGCTSNSKHKNKLANNYQHKTDISEYLAPYPKPPKDDTSLFALCTCPEGLKVKRYQCLNCIRSWVNAVSLCTAQSTLEELKTKGHVIAVERLETAIKEKRQQEMFVMSIGCEECCECCGND